MGAGDLAQANVSFPRSPFPANCDVAGGVGIDPDSERVADHPPAGPGKYYGVTREQSGSNGPIPPPMNLC
jgi:hypothetical protein